MTHLLQRAFAKIAKLPEAEQNAFAHWAMAELASETRWEHAFAESENQLAKFASEAIAENKSGKTKSLDPKKL